MVKPSAKLNKFVRSSSNFRPPVDVRKTSLSKHTRPHHTHTHTHTHASITHTHTPASHTHTHTHTHIYIYIYILP